MARTVRDANLSSRSARALLRPAGKRFWRAIDSGLHLGYRRGKAGGVWIARYYNGGMTYQLETIGRADDTLDADGDVILNFAQAQALARKRYVERERTRAGLSAEVGPFTVKQAMGDYEEAYKAGHTKGGGKRPKDLQQRIAAFILPELGDVEVAKLTAERIRKWHAALAAAAPRLRTKKGEAQQHAAMGDDEDTVRRRRASANRNLTTLKAALNAGFAAGKVGSDAAWRQVRPFAATNAARVRYLGVAEAKRLINAADHASGFRALVQAALLTGCRYGELCALDVRDYNADSKTLHVRTSKTNKGRHVVLTDEGAEFFGALCAGRPGEEAMLAKADGSRWDRWHQGRPMREACQRARIKPISFHGLRHTWASLAIMAGVPLLVVARCLGHCDTRMCELHYGHLAPSFIANAIRERAPSFGIKRGNVRPLAARR